MFRDNQGHIHKWIYVFLGILAILPAGYFIFFTKLIVLLSHDDVGIFWTDWEVIPILSATLLFPFLIGLSFILFGIGLLKRTDTSDRNILIAITIAILGFLVSLIDPFSDGRSSQEISYLAVIALIFILQANSVASGITQRKK